MPSRPEAEPPARRRRRPGAQPSRRPPRTPSGPPRRYRTPPRARCPPANAAVRAHARHTRPRAAVSAIWSGRSASYRPSTGRRAYASRTRRRSSTSWVSVSTMAQPARAAVSGATIGSAAGPPPTPPAPNGVRVSRSTSSGGGARTAARATSRRAASTHGVACSTYHAVDRELHREHRVAIHGFTIGSLSSRVSQSSTTSWVGPAIPGRARSTGAHRGSRASTSSGVSGVGPTSAIAPDDVEQLGSSSRGAADRLPRGVTRGSSPAVTQAGRSTSDIVGTHRPELVHFERPSVAADPGQRERPGPGSWARMRHVSTPMTGARRMPRTAAVSRSSGAATKPATHRPTARPSDSTTRSTSASPSPGCSGRLRTRSASDSATERRRKRALRAPANHANRCRGRK